MGQEEVSVGLLLEQDLLHCPKCEAGEVEDKADVVSVNAIMGDAAAFRDRLWPTMWPAERR
ncbi:hypothetical protein MY8738_009288 [Beauveria namnaoensis]